MRSIQFRDILSGGNLEVYVQAGQGFFVLALYNDIVFNFNSGYAGT